MGNTMGDLCSSQAREICVGVACFAFAIADRGPSGRLSLPASTGYQGSDLVLGTKLQNLLMFTFHQVVFVLDGDDRSCFLGLADLFDAHLGKADVLDLPLCAQFHQLAE
jgi:hypothetical protein